MAIFYPTIGARSFHTLGWRSLDEVQIEIKDTAPTHVDGAELVLQSKRPKLEALVGEVDLDANGGAADFATISALWYAMVGTLQTVTTHPSEPTAYVAIFGVKVLERRPIAGAVNPLSTTAAEWVKVAFTCMRTDV